MLFCALIIIVQTKNAKMKKVPMSILTSSFPCEFGPKTSQECVLFGGRNILTPYACPTYQTLSERQCPKFDDSKCSNKKQNQS